MQGWKQRTCSTWSKAGLAQCHSETQSYVEFKAQSAQGPQTVQRQNCDASSGCLASQRLKNSSHQTKKCIPSCDNTDRGRGEVRAPQEGCESSRNGFTEPLLLHQSSVNQDTIKTCQSRVNQQTDAGENAELLLLSKIYMVNQNCKVTI